MLPKIVMANHKIPDISFYVRSPNIFKNIAKTIRIVVLKNCVVCSRGVLCLRHLYALYSQITNSGGGAEELPSLPEPEGTVLKNHLKQVILFSVD